MTGKDYRPDIDGLRAIAILTVVAFHVGLPGAALGYLGVDIFFVISGYLISGLLLREVQTTGRIDIAEFYARRVRRLVPALAVVLLSVVVMGIVLLAPTGEQQGLGKSVAAAAGFGGNIDALLQEWGYSNTAAYTMPLLHTWTLAVEEQFYLIWPVAIVILAVIARRLGINRERVMALGFGAAFVASIGLAAGLQTVRPDPVFYLMPFRVWELAAGGLAVLAGQRFGEALRKLAPVLQLAGLAMIGAGLLGGTPQSAVGPAALLVVTGTAILLLSGVLASTSLASRVLGSPPMTVLGKLSYSWYLWHWPILCLVRIENLGRLDVNRDILAALGALGLAALTWRFIEQPVRLRRPGPFATRGGTLWAGAGLLAACAIAGGGLWLWGDRPVPAGSLQDRLRHISSARNVPGSHCLAKAGLAPNMEQICDGGAANAAHTIVLLGDSHADHWRPALAELAGPHDFRLLSRTRSACRPTYPLTAAPTDPCTTFNSKVRAELATLAAQSGVRSVIISAHWRDIDGERPEMWEAGLRRQIAALRASGLRVAIVGDTTHFAFPVAVCLSRRDPADCAVSRLEFEKERRRVVESIRRAVDADPQAAFFDLADTACDDATCPAYKDGVVLYYDNNHLTPEGARFLKPGLEPVVRWVLAGPDEVAPPHQ